MVPLSLPRSGQFPVLRHLINRFNAWKPVFPEEIEGQFHGSGYLIIDPEIPEHVLDQVRADMDARPELKHSDHHGSRWFDGWTKSRAIKSVALAPKVLRVLRQFFGREPLPFQTLNFRIGTEQRLHSDTIHFSSDPPTFMVGVWVALEDMDQFNGPLVYYPYSHTLPVVRMEDVASEAGPKHYAAYEDRIQQVIDSSGLKPHHATIRKGQALIWASNLVHGGSEQLDESRTRYSQVTHYFFEGCQYYMPLNSYGGYRHLLKPQRIR